MLGKLLQCFYLVYVEVKAKNNLDQEGGGSISSGLYITEVGLLYKAQQTDVHFANLRVFIG